MCLATSPPSCPGGVAVNVLSADQLLVKPDSRLCLCPSLVFGCVYTTDISCFPKLLLSMQAERNIVCSWWTLAKPLIRVSGVNEWSYSLKAQLKRNVQGSGARPVWFFDWVDAQKNNLVKNLISQKKTTYWFASFFAIRQRTPEAFQNISF